MTEHEELVEALLGMSKITRPRGEGNTPEEKRQNKITNGICDMMEDAAMAIEELLEKSGEKSEIGERAKAA